MKFSGKRILIVSPDHWSALPVSKHHYAIELAKCNKVVFLDPDPTQGLEETEEGVIVLGDYRRIRGLGKLPKWLSKTFMKLEVNSIFSKLRIDSFDVVWSFDTSRLYYLDLFESDLKIAHIVDYSENYHFKELAESADVCFATSESIINKFKQFNDRVYKVDHGFVEPSKIAYPNSFEKKKCIYIGNLTIPYLDWESVNRLVTAFPKVDFEFIGSKDGDIEVPQLKFMRQIESMPNISILDRIPPEEVYSKISSADFCLICYRYSDFPLQLENPHKVMQYLGTGKPIFASFTSEYKDLDLLYMYEDRSSIETEFQNFLEDEKNYFSQDSAFQRIRFALNNTYAKQIEKIEKLV